MAAAAAAAERDSADSEKDGAGKRESKVQRSKVAAIASFDGASFDELPVKKRPRL